MGNKLLIIGGSGELGTQIIRQLSDRDVCSTYYSAKKLLSHSNNYMLDVRDLDSVENIYATGYSFNISNENDSDLILIKFDNLGNIQYN